ncbi:MAG: hypothetical protein LPK19_00070 [Hymenobacteraceae bacterium]|nr:hypothetical protein [Hymenobacteraceae bacterium]MDX5394567.1 hypothetical protein [Hymenobacteraceae bacterium]MDX5510588.1 hypothetical protein [Hymenobacteraceae bacterium]
MDAKALNASLVALISKKEELNKLDYNDSRYDDIEEELHDLEDDFNEEFGDYLEEVLEEVHGKINSDTDVLLPTAYLPGMMLENGSPLTDEDGVVVDSEKYPNKEARLLLMPNPARLVLYVNHKQVEEVWQA